MPFELMIDPGEAVPIWKQIEDGVRRGVARGELEPGDAVPSVRELAVVLRVNPATVAKAYRRLVEGGILTVRRGEGTFVAQPPGPGVQALRRAELEGAARRYAATAAELGASRDEAVDALETAWKERHHG